MTFWQTVKHATLALLSIGLLLSGVPAASAQAPPFGPNEGEVREIDKVAGEITINHGPLPELSMDPMTMVFKVADLALLNGVKVGDRARFKTDLVDGEFGVTSIDLVTAPVRRALAQAPVTFTHVLAASWNSNAIYVWNPAPSSRIRAPWASLQPRRKGL